MRQMFYRVEQFWRALLGAPDPAGLARVEKVLSPALFDLFRQMLPFEQAHAIRVFDKLLEQGSAHPGLLTAGLLHDVGKVRYPLAPWERAVAVLVKRLFPGKAVLWGQGEPVGWKAGVVVADQHALWGAEMAEAAGASEQVVRLIACHQDQEPSFLSEEELAFLLLLQSVDDVS